MQHAPVVEAVLLDKKEILTVSTRAGDYCGIGDVCLSLPAVVGANGIERVLTPQLADSEREKLLASAALLKTVLESVSG